MHKSLALGCALWTLSSLSVALAQTTDVPCRPVSDRKGDAGCWIIGSHPVGKLTDPEVFWHLDTYSDSRDRGKRQGSAWRGRRVLGQSLAAEY
jgi:hypothetical protein